MCGLWRIKTNFSKLLSKAVDCVMLILSILGSIGKIVSWKDMTRAEVRARDQGRD